VTDRDPKTSRRQVTDGGWWCDADHCAEHGRMTCMTDHPPINCRATKRSGERRAPPAVFVIRKRAGAADFSEDRRGERRKA
jgi:hypothetical protein